MDRVVLVVKRPRNQIKEENENQGEVVEVLPNTRA
jgi:hypothetical protein